ncbi:MAG: ribonuclease H1 domain-containing protein [Mesonia hippocampi]|uniref:ribonuclease H1 domain-containing protein n=1 Tax=Mesonia hippocampi TaxID=1628250 RepID=UPI003F97EF8B
MAKTKKYYVVWKGHKPGVYDSWQACKKSIDKYKGAQYKSFLSLQEAKKAFDKSFNDYKNKNTKTTYTTAAQLALIKKEVNFNSIAVDAASSGNPGKMEYQGVDTASKKVLFKIGPFEQGTNNIGEFLALVHGLAFLKQHKSNRIIYTDSKIAQGWVSKKKCNTKLAPNAKNKELFELIARAEHWLKTNTYTTNIVKWQTKRWGEIPADFGRK